MSRSQMRRCARLFEKVDQYKTGERTACSASVYRVNEYGIARYVECVRVFTVCGERARASGLSQPRSLLVVRVDQHGRHQRVGRH